MPLYSEIFVPVYADGTFVIPLSPPAPVGGLSAEFALALRFSSDAVILTRTVASGYGDGSSGITVIDSGQGRFSIRQPTPEEMSGRDPGPYAFQFSFTDSGNRAPAVQGYADFQPDLRR